MPKYKVLIEQVKSTGGVAHRETVKVDAEDEAQAIRESDFVRTLRFVGGEYEKRVTVLGVIDGKRELPPMPEGVIENLKATPYFYGQGGLF